MWKEIENYPNYEIADDGRVKSLGRMSESRPPNFVKPRWIEERILKPQKSSTRSQYLQVRLFNEEKKKGDLFYIHRLVAHHFIQPLKDDDHIHHKDEDPSNNHKSNIEVINKHDHITKHHTHYRPISDSTVVKIREDLIHGKVGDCPKIAKKYGIPLQTVYKIKSHERYKHIGRWKLCKERGLKRLTDDDVRQIRKDVQTMEIKEVADKWKKTVSVIYDIKNKRTFKNVK